jgi:hypothetical protein
MRIKSKPHPVDEPRGLRGLTNVPGLITGIVSGISLAGAIIYAALVQAYDEYYRAFGLAPDDVGLGYSQVLYRAAGILAGLALILGLAACVLLIVFPRSWLAAMGRRGRRTFGAALLCILAAVGAASLGLSYEAHVRGQDALDGQPVAPWEVLGGPILDVRAERATVSWLTSGPPKSLPDVVLYLGTSNGNFVVLRPLTDEIDLIPVSAATVEIFQPEH